MPRYRCAVCQGYRVLKDVNRLTNERSKLLDKLEIPIIDTGHICRKCNRELSNKKRKFEKKLKNDRRVNGSSKLESGSSLSGFKRNTKANCQHAISVVGRRSATKNKKFNNEENEYVYSLSEYSDTEDECEITNVLDDTLSLPDNNIDRMSISILLIYKSQTTILFQKMARSVCLMINIIVLKIHWLFL